jgi:hypothetical protein
MRRDRGSVLVWTAFVVGLVAVLLVCTGRIGSAGTTASRAQAVADLAALAAVDGGHRAADEVARRNGARLVGYADDTDVVVVRVRCRGATATARATADTSSARGAPRLPPWPSIPPN